MPIRFRCVDCGQLLSIARRKAGTAVSCPRCHRDVTVPIVGGGPSPLPPRENAPKAAVKSSKPAKRAAILESDEFDEWVGLPPRRSSDSSDSSDSVDTSASTGHTTPVPEQSWSLDDPEESDSEEVIAEESLDDMEESSEAPVPMRTHSQFAGLSKAGRTEGTHGPDGSYRASGGSSGPFASKGVLVGSAAILTLVGFGLGVVVGRYAVPSIPSGVAPSAAAASPSPTDPNEAEGQKAAEEASEPAKPKTAEAMPQENSTPKAVINGRILYRDKGPSEPLVGDEGASVIVFPSGKSPGNKVEILGLRPQDANLQNRPGRDQVKLWGGAVGTVDGKGDFELGVDQPHGYYILVVSRNVKRAAGHEMLADDLIALQQFFADPAALIGDNAYVLLYKNLKLEQPTSVAYTLDP